MNATYVNPSTKNLEEKMQFSHAFFVATIDGYSVLKDNFNHVSVGSIISNTMLNHYLASVPSSAKITIEESE